MLSPAESFVLALAVACFALPLVLGIVPPKVDEQRTKQLGKVRRS